MTGDSLPWQLYHYCEAENQTYFAPCSHKGCCENGPDFYEVPEAEALRLWNYPEMAKASRKDAYKQWAKAKQIAAENAVLREQNLAMNEDCVRMQKALEEISSYGSIIATEALNK